MKRLLYCLGLRPVEYLNSGIVAQSQQINYSENMTGANNCEKFNFLVLYVSKVKRIKK